jgi:hypothetical protein
MLTDTVGPVRPRPKNAVSGIITPHNRTLPSGRTYWSCSLTLVLGEQFFDHLFAIAEVRLLQPFDSLG